MRVITSSHLQGFTLIEIAIVLVIVGLLLGGLLMPLATQVEVQRRTETERTMEQIREAMIGFAIANGRLPCPADPAIATGTINAGNERNPAGPCTGGLLGVVPWVTLGVNELDAWGRRFTYRVTPSLADSDPTTVTPPPGCLQTTVNASFALCSVGNMDIRTGLAPAAFVATAIPAVIVSHGKNGRGAFLPTGTQMTCPAVPIPPPVLPPPEEVANADCPGKPPTLFISRTPTTATAPGGEFDDIITWIAPPTLMKSMVDAGRLP